MPCGSYYWWRKPPRPLAFCALVVLCALRPAAAQEQHADHASPQPDARDARHDVLVFVSARASETSAAVKQTYLDDNEFTPSADLFYTRNGERFRFLAEYLLTDDEHDLERLQVGWQLSEATRLWVGRFHQSANYWNTEHHHGQFLQTSIYRPAIEEFEDTGSLLPSHTTGILLEHRREFGNGAGLQLSFSAGLTGTLEGNPNPQIEPFNLLHMQSGHGNSVSVRVGLFPEVLGENQIGFSFGRHMLNAASDMALAPQWQPGVDAIDLNTLGLYGVWSHARWRFVGATNRVGSQPRGGLGGSQTHFAATYGQVEYRMPGAWTVFSRIEHTAGSTDYTRLFPLFLRAQALVGVKALLSRKHALTVEIGNAATQAERFHRVSVQWSAVFP